MSNIEVKISNIQQELQAAQNQLANDLFNNQVTAEENELILQLEKWNMVQEKILRQRSRATWIAYGDANTKYFQAQLKARQARNRISSICNEQGFLVSKPTIVQQQFLVYYRQLLGDTNTTMPCIDTTIARDGPCLSLSQQQEMLGTVTREEILRVIKDLLFQRTLGNSRRRHCQCCTTIL